MLRGIRRLFMILAAIFFGLTNMAYLSAPVGSVAHTGYGNILIGTLFIGSIGWIITFLAKGFQSPRNRIIDVTPRRKDR